MLIVEFGLRQFVSSMGWLYLQTYIHSCFYIEAVLSMITKNYNLLTKNKIGGFQPVTHDFGRDKQNPKRAILK